jgi:hypothetical protein
MLVDFVPVLWRIKGNASYEEHGTQNRAVNLYISEVYSNFSYFAFDCKLKSMLRRTASSHLINTKFSVVLLLKLKCGQDAQTGLQVLN